MSAYNIYKDYLPSETVKKIKKILKDNKIAIQEKYTFNDKERLNICPSVRVEFKDTTIGTNGKGTCIDNSFASAYGEFMERLQTGSLIKFTFSDEVILNKKEIKEDVLGEYKLNGFSENIKASPFYSMKTKQIEYIPNDIFISTNGMAAGNTIEEACVQGLSEICERYALKKLIINKLAIPNVPPEYYMKYKNIKKIMKYYNSNGYNIYIKDASLGENLPVICAIATNKLTNTLIITAGAHPSFPVAIERTLTELFQGCNLTINDIDKQNSNMYITKEYFNKYIDNNRMLLFEKINQKSTRFEINDSLMQQFLLQEPSYKFNPNSWIKSSKNITNIELLEFIINNIKKITNNNIYFRTFSFLGFPTIRIYIPNMSRVLLLDAKDREERRKWINYNGESDSFYDDISSLQRVVALNCEHPDLSSISNLPSEYIALLISIVLNETNRVIYYADKLLDESYTQKTITNLIKTYFIYKKDGLNDEQINKILIKTYPSSDLDFLYKFIHHLSFNVIKKLILKNKIQKNNIEIKKHLKDKLSNLFSQNMPNQIDLKKVLSSFS